LDDEIAALSDGKAAVSILVEIWNNDECGNMLQYILVCYHLSLSLLFVILVCNHQNGGVRTVQWEPPTIQKCANSRYLFLLRYESFSKRGKSHSIRFYRSRWWWFWLAFYSTPLSLEIKEIKKYIEIYIFLES
jgi:hypothetical protein